MNSRTTVFMLVTTLAASAMPAAAPAFTCAVPALYSPAKKTVCSTPMLHALDQSEVESRDAIASKFSIDGRSILNRDRRQFLAARDRCAADARCLEIAYRSQMQLYQKLEDCAVQQDKKQTFCISLNTQRHRAGQQRAR